MKRNAQTRLLKQKNSRELTIGSPMTKLDELHTKPPREFLLSSVFMTSQVAYSIIKRKKFSVIC